MTKHELRAQVTVIRVTPTTIVKLLMRRVALEQLLKPPVRGFLPGPAAMTDAMHDLVGRSIGTMGVSNTIAGGAGRKATFALGDPCTISLDSSRALGSLAFSQRQPRPCGQQHADDGCDGGCAGECGGQQPNRHGSEPVAGADGLRKSGLGTLVFAGANTITGTTTVTNGTLVLQSTYASSSFAIATNAALELNTDSGEKNYGTATSRARARCVRRERTKPTGAQVSPRSRWDPVRGLTCKTEHWWVVPMAMRSGLATSPT